MRRSHRPLWLQRRRVIHIAAVGLAAPLAVATRPAIAALSGDRLVEEDAEGAPQPLRVADLKPGKPMLAYPFDTKTGKPRDETRLNKIVLVRLPEADMTPETRARAAMPVRIDTRWICSSWPTYAAGSASASSPTTSAPSSHRPWRGARRSA